jgi:hypothetical protein
LPVVLRFDGEVCVLDRRLPECGKHRAYRATTHLDPSLLGAALPAHGQNRQDLGCASGRPPALSPRKLHTTSTGRRLRCSSPFQLCHTVVQLSKGFGEGRQSFSEKLCCRVLG